MAQVPNFWQKKKTQRDVSTLFLPHSGHVAHHTRTDMLFTTLIAFWKEP